MNLDLPVLGFDDFRNNFFRADFDPATRGEAIRLVFRNGLVSGRFLVSRGGHIVSDWAKDSSLAWSRNRVDRCLDMAATADRDLLEQRPELSGQTQSHHGTFWETGIVKHGKLGRKFDFEWLVMPCLD